MKKKENLKKKIVRLAIFLALGIVLNIIETMIPLPIAIPGIRLGLANTMGLIVLYFYNPKEYLIIGLLRVFLVGLLRTGLGSVAFFLSLAGWFLSSIITLFIYFAKKASVYGLSISSAIFHQVGQIIVVMIIYQLPSMINYLPVLLVSAIISGFLVAFISSKILDLLRKIFGFQDFDDKDNKKVNKKYVVYKQV